MPPNLIYYVIWVCMYGITFQIMIVKVNVLFFRFNINYKSKWKVNCCWKRILLSLKRPRFWEDFTLFPRGCLRCKVPGSPLFLPCHVGGSESDGQLDRSSAVSSLSSLLNWFQGWINTDKISMLEKSKPDDLFRL